MNSFFTKRLSRLGLVSVVGLGSALGMLAQAQAAGGTALCTGTPAADVPLDVTSKMSQVASGVKVYQLTGLDKNGKVVVDRYGKTIPNYITNTDITNYTPLNPPSFMVNSSAVLAKTIRVDHSGAQLVGTIAGHHVRVSLDGKLIAQTGKHQGGEDVFITDLTAATCKSVWITNQNFTIANSAGASGDVITPPVWDASVGKYLIAYAPGGGNSPQSPVVYSVYSDGSTTPYTPMEPVDKCKGLLYHKVRMDYRWPYLVFLQREKAIGVNVCGDLMDLRTGYTIEYGDGTGGSDPSKWQIYYNHDDQSSDGQHLMTNASLGTGGFALAKLMDDNGNFIPGSNQPNPIPGLNGHKPIPNPAGYVVINPTGSNVAPEWCNFQPNNKALCSAGTGSGGSALGKLPSGCHPVFTIDPATYASRFLACTDSNKTGAYIGIAMIRYSYTSGDGNYHALFRSDKTGTPQTYELVYKP